MNVTQWSVMSSSRCRELSRVSVLTERTPRALTDEIECAGTLYDSRMGPRFEGDTCGTCGGSFRVCKLGHYGMIEFDSCVLVNQYFPYIANILRSVCITCQRVVSKTATNPCKRCTKYKTVTNEKNGTIKVNGEVWTADKTYTVLALCGAPDRPENMLFNNMLVLPNPSRPIHVSKPPKRTLVRVHRYAEPYAKIVKLVNKRRTLTEFEKRFLDKDLYDAVNVLLMSNKPGRAGTTQAACKEEDVSGVLSSIVSKKGLIRNNLMGKRVDFSARGVAAGDPTLKVDEFGLPSVWRSKLTMPVRVFSQNKTEMQDIVRVGQWTSITQGGGGDMHYDMDYTPKSHWRRIADLLSDGDVVERWLRDGDPVILIRQPTLHKGSMMCGKVRLHPRHTVEMNVNVTTPFNGDFDGDEFNAFVPRTETARVEFEELFSVKHQIVNENGRCQIFPIQNAVLGMYRATLENPLVLPRVGPGVCTESKCRDRIKQIWYDEGPDAAVSAIQEVSDIANAWLERHGASLGMNEFDCARLDPPRESDGALLKAKKLQAQAVLRNLRDESYDDGKAFNEASVYLNSLRPYDESLDHMIKSGCKGSSTNKLNVALVVGKQSVSDMDLKPFFGTHILPCGLKRGFIPTGYIQGLKPEHTAIHQMSGRYGVYTKSVGVKASGQRFREMGQCMENLVVSPSLSVLDESDNVVQLVYGEDGLDPKWSGVTKSGLPAYPLDHYKHDPMDEVPEMLRTLSEKSAAYFGSHPTAPRGAIRDWMRAVVPYGHAVGIIAAQSIGEPATQELLNKIHSGEKNQKKSNMPRLFKPGKGGEIVGRAVPGVPVPPIVLKWYVTKTRPQECEWTRRYEAYEAFPCAEEYLVLVFDREVDLLCALRKLPNRRSMHPALDGNDGIEVHVALVNRLDPQTVLGVFTPSVSDVLAFTACSTDVTSVYKNGPELVCVGDFHTVLTQPWIEGAYSDDACAMAEVLGIDAAREMLVKEFTRTFGNKVDVRHVTLMVDAMTYTGTVRAMDYYGFRDGSDPSIIGRACFRDAIKTFVGAAATNHRVMTNEDGMRRIRHNVTESVVTGCMSSLGTGSVCVALDVAALERNVYDAKTAVSCTAGASALGPALCVAAAEARPVYTPRAEESVATIIPFSPNPYEDEDEDDDDEPAYVPSEDVYRPTTPDYEPDPKRCRMTETTTLDAEVW